MADKLIIVESPAKANTIKKFLGGNTKVVASMGHIRDLPKSKMGVDVEHDFEPEYISFEKMKYDEHIIIHNYLETLGQLIRALGINEYYDCVMGDKEFSKIRTKVKQFENKIRRYR